MWNTVLFDLDGTLSDSAPGITRCVQYALEKEFGIIRHPEELTAFVGPPLKEQFMLYTGCSEEMGERAVERYRERYRPVGIFENKLYPGIPELLKQLRDEHFTIALTSSKPEEFCRQILDMFEITKYFDFICGSDMAGKHTDKAELTETVVRALKMEDRRSEVVLVGDRKYDIIGAKTCGVGSIGVSYGYGSREELEYEWPDCIVDNVTELRNVLIGQMRAGRRSNFPEGASGSGTYYEEDIQKAVDGSALFKIWRIVYPLFLHMGITNLAASIFSMFLILFSMMSGGTIEDSLKLVAAQSVLFLGFADAFVVPAGWLFFRSDERKRRAAGLNSRILVKNRAGFPEYLCIALLVIGCASILNLLISYIPINDEIYESTAEQMFESTPFLIQLIVIGVIAPFAEEVIFRGLVYRRLRDYTGFMWAVIASGLIFGIYHGNVTQGIFAFFMGMLFATIYEHYGTLWAAIAAHMSNNLFATVENYIFRNNQVPGFLYLVFVGVTLLAAAACFFRILKKEDRVNNI